MRLKVNSRRERGYVLAFVGILLIPLMAFTSFSVDLGSWYSEAARLQQAADAAALAGAAELPNTTAAEATAINIARKNGFVNGANGATVDVTFPTSLNNRVRVTITLDELPQYFSRVLNPERVSLSRSSEAEYAPVMRMGSPRNYLGTGACPRGRFVDGRFDDLSPFGNGNDCATETENWLLAIAPPCVPRTQGHRFAGTAETSDNRFYLEVQNQPGSIVTTAYGRQRRDDNNTSGPWVGYPCLPLTAENPNVSQSWLAQDEYEPRLKQFRTISNPEYDPNGQYFGVTVPAGQSVQLQSFNLGWGVSEDGICKAIGFTGATRDYRVENEREIERPPPGWDDDETKGMFELEWTVYDNGSFDPRALTVSGNVPADAVLATGKIDVCDAGHNGWAKLGDLTAAGTPKTFWLNIRYPEPTAEQAESIRNKVSTDASTNSGFPLGGRLAHQYFSLRVASPSGAFSPCSTDPSDPVYSTDTVAKTCPNIFATENMAASFTLPTEQRQRDFYIASLPDYYNNKTISIEAYDLDAGSEWVQIIKPDGGLQRFTGSILCRDGTRAQGDFCPSVNGDVENAPANIGGTPAGIGEFPSGSTNVGYSMGSGTTFYPFRGTPFLPATGSNVAWDATVGANNWSNIAGVSRVIYPTLDTDPLTVVAAPSQRASGTSGRTLAFSFDKERVEVPSNWWKMRFRAQGVPDDVVTISLRVTGDPVRLIPTLF